MKSRKKNKKNKNLGITCKLMIDRFFENCRTKHHIYAFQNESKIKINFLNEIKMPYIITDLPKRCYFVNGSNNLLVENGFIMYFSNFTKEQFQTVKHLLFYYFKNSFQIKTPLNDLRNLPPDTKLSGKFILNNLKIKENIND